MISSQTFTSVPAFSSGGAKVQPDGSTYAAGYVSPVELPAEHLNWFLGGLTGNGLTEQAAINNIITELDNLVTGAGLSPDGTGSSQVLSAVEILNGQSYSPGASPYTMSGAKYRVYLVTTGASAFEFDVATAASILGYGEFMVVKVDSGAGAVQVKPNGADVFQNAGNVSLYLGAQWQFVKFAASASGNLVVTSGTFAPHQTVDTDGSQYELGKLHHLPLANTTNREITGSTIAIPTLSSWSSAIQVTGSYGVPTGAVAVRIRAMVFPFATAGGMVGLTLDFSNNTANTPNYNNTAHPAIYAYGYVPGSQTFIAVSEIDVPLNSSGQFYIYTQGDTNCTIASSSLQAIAVGYYMGD